MLGGYDEMVIGFRECIKLLKTVNNNISNLADNIARSQPKEKKEEKKTSEKAEESRQDYCTILKTGEAYKLYKCSVCDSVFIANLFGQHKYHEVSVRCPVCNNEVENIWQVYGKPLREVIAEAKDKGYEIPLDFKYESSSDKISEEEIAYIEQYTGFNFAPDSTNEVKGRDLLGIDELIRNARRSYKFHKDMEDLDEKTESNQ